MLKRLVFTFWDSEKLDKHGLATRSTDYLQYKTSNPDYYLSLLTKRNAFRVLHQYQEKKWRNEELSATDYMMVEDSTYKGKIILTYTTYKEDIIKYRTALRNYDGIADRPQQPVWM